MCICVLGVLPIFHTCAHLAVSRTEVNLLQQCDDCVTVKKLSVSGWCFDVCVNTFFSQIFIFPGLLQLIHHLDYIITSYSTALQPCSLSFRLNSNRSHLYNMCLVSKWNMGITKHVFVQFLLEGFLIVAVGCSHEKWQKLLSRLRGEKKKLKITKIVTMLERYGWNHLIKGTCDEVYWQIKVYYNYFFSYI